MSYSFVARGQTKEKVLAEIDKQLAHTVQHQPAHIELDKVKAVVHDFVGMMGDPGKGEHYVIAVAGSVDGDKHVKHLAVNINASLGPMQGNG